MMHAAFTGPYILKKRLGETSWMLNSGVREFSGHSSWIKRCWGPVYGGRRIPLAHEKFSKTATAEIGEKEYEVDHILKHKTEKGVVKVLTLWKGYLREDATWEPVSSFIHRYSTDLVTYAKEHGLENLPVLKYLQDEPNDRPPPIRTR